ncbi:hypothetical protein Vadar_026431 [Vaccinium darrowii]|uniref:Uncharacterized protein n=1 Tax=Vaccinium darrowii TaxID=229202 RepID=A0ACB7YYJ3_9ERIC|nr:hypothetical protein Vadar_026431 [Vaccinium darrowii]
MYKLVNTHGGLTQERLLQVITGRNPMTQRLYYHRFMLPILLLNTTSFVFSLLVGPVIDTDGNAAVSEWAAAAVGNHHPTCSKNCGFPQLLHFLGIFGHERIRFARGGGRSFNRRWLISIWNHKALLYWPSI